MPTLACLTLAWLAAAPPDLEEARPPGASARLGSLRFRNGVADTSIAYLPGGREVVCSGSQPSVWDAATGRRVRTYSTPHGHIYGLRVAPGGKTFLTWGNTRDCGPDPVARLWDAASGGEVQKFAGHVDTVRAAAFSADGRRVATADDKTLRLWDAATGRELRRISVAERHPCVSFSPDGRLVAAASEKGVVTMWAAATGAAVQHFPAPAGVVYGIVFSPDGRLAAWGSSDFSASEVVVADVAGGRVLRRLKFNVWQGVCPAPAFSPDGRTLAAACYGAKPRLWDAIHEGPAVELDGGTPGAVAFSPDGRTLAGLGGDQALRFWDVLSGRLRARPDGHDAPVVAVAFGPDGRTVTSASTDGTARRWDTATGRQTGSFATGLRQFGTASFSAGGERLAAPGPVLWHVPTGEKWPDFEGANANANYSPVALSADGLTVAAGGAVWEVRSGDRLKRAGDDVEAARTVARVAASADGMVTAEVESQHGIRSHYQLTLRDRGGCELHTFEEGREDYSALAFSPDGKVLATSGGQGPDRPGVQLWDVVTGKPLRWLGCTGWLPGAALAFSPDGRTLAVARGAGAELWDVARGERRGNVGGHRGSVTCLAFRPDGQALATGSDDTTVLLWPLAPGP